MVPHLLRRYLLDKSDSSIQIFLSSKLKENLLIWIFLSLPYLSTIASKLILLMKTTIAFMEMKQMLSTQILQDWINIMKSFLIALTLL